MYSDIDNLIDDCKSDELLIELNRIKKEGSEVSESFLLLFEDSVSSILREMSLYSSKKEFYSVLDLEFLDYSDLTKVSAFMTHIFIAFNKRLKVRKHVDKKSFMYLTLLCSKIINAILEDGTSLNLLDVVYKENVKETDGRVI